MNLVKTLLKIATLLGCVILTLYHLYFFILPSVTVVNFTQGEVNHAKIKLPNSGLDFGVIPFGTEQTIYYALAQTKGDYHYQFILENGVVLSGQCGKVANNEYHKRLQILIKDNHILCQ